MTKYSAEQFLTAIINCNWSDSSKTSELLVVAYDMIVRTDSPLLTKLRKEKIPDRKRFMDLIRLEAYESAVMVLLPENVQYSICSRGESSISYSEKGRRLFYDSVSRDPILSLLSSILSYYYIKIK